MLTISPILIILQSLIDAKGDNKVNRDERSSNETNLLILVNYNYICCFMNTKSLSFCYNR